MGFEKTNKTINERIHQISIKFNDSSITEREINEIASLVYPKLRYHISKLCQNSDDTDEALQFTLKKIFNNIHKFDVNKGRFTTWVYTIARNETLYYLHIKKKNRTTNVELGHERGECNEGEIFIKFEDEYQSLYDMTISEIYGIEDTLLQSIAIDKMINREKVRCIAYRYSINENTVKTKLRKIRSDIKTKVLQKNPAFRETLNHIFDL